MRTRKPISAVTDARKSAQHANQARDQAHADAIENALDHSQPRDWGAIFEAKRRTIIEAADKAYRARIAAYANSAEPDANWLIEDILRWSAEHGIRMPLPGEEITAEQTAICELIVAASKQLPPDTRWKPDASTPVLSNTFENGARASRELADRVSRYFADNPTATYREAAHDLNISTPAITGAKRRILEECALSGEIPPAWAMRSKNRRQRPDAHVRLMSNDELLEAMKVAKDGADE